MRGKGEGVPNTLIQNKLFKFANFNRKYSRLIESFDAVAVEIGAKSREMEKYNASGELFIHTRAWIEEKGRREGGGGGKRWRREGNVALC